MLTRNNEITTSNSKGLCQKHNGKCQVGFFPFYLGKKGHEGMLKALNMILKNTKSVKKYIRNVGGTMVKNILYFILSHRRGVLRTIGKYGSRKEDVGGGGHWKGPILFCVQSNKGHPKKKKKTLRMDLCDHGLSSVVIKLLFFKIV